MSKHPPLLWSQLRDSVNIIINVQDAQNVKIEISDIAADGNASSSSASSNLKISLSSSSLQSGAQQQQFACDLVLFAPVEAALSSQEIKPRGVHITLSKRKNSSSWFWPRLIQSKVKNTNISIDWSNWKDEDDLEKFQQIHNQINAATSGNNNKTNQDLFSGLDSLDTGGLHMDSEEIQNTLAALRQQQLEMKQSQLSGGISKNTGVELTEKEKRELMEELRGAKMEDELMKMVPAFGSAKNVPVQQNDDDEDETVPDLV